MAQDDGSVVVWGHPAYGGSCKNGWMLTGVRLLLNFYFRSGSSNHCITHFYVSESKLKSCTFSQIVTHAIFILANLHYNTMPDMNGVTWRFAELRICATQAAFCVARLQSLTNETNCADQRAAANRHTDATPGAASCVEAYGTYNQ